MGFPPGFFKTPVVQGSEGQPRPMRQVASAGGPTGGSRLDIRTRTDVK